MGNYQLIKIKNNECKYFKILIRDHTWMTVCTTCVGGSVLLSRSTTGCRRYRTATVTATQPPLEPLVSTSLI